MAKLKKETVETLKRNPIYTTDFNKIKSYQDSLNAYSKGEEIYNKFFQFANKNNLPLNKINNFIRENDFGGYGYAYLPIDKINKNIPPKELYSFDRLIDLNFKNDLVALDKNKKRVSQQVNNKLDSLLNSYRFLPYGELLPRYEQPIQPYMLPKDELNKIQSKGVVENDEIEGPELVSLKNEKINVKEPSEHFLDISEPNGKETKRMYFDTRKQLEDFQKENPMLKTGSFSRAMIDPRILEILKKKK
jgi:hypothetical protein